MKVLIILCGSAADIVFSTALVRTVKVQLDDPEITYLTSPIGAGMLEANPYLHSVLRWDERNTLRNMKFDFIIDLESTFKSRLFVALLKGAVMRFKRRHVETWLLTRLKIRKLRSTNLAEQYVATAKNIGIQLDELRLDYFIPYKDEVPAEWLPEPFRKGFVTLCIASDYSTRRLPLNRMVELCDRINKPVIILGEKEDHETGAAIERFFAKGKDSAHFEEGLTQLNKKTIVYNACGKFNVNQQASLVKQSRYVFSFDNLFIPVASAFGKETFAIYGNTVLDFGRYPWQTRYTILENNKISCRPCSHKGYNSCPLKHFKCMNEIVFDFYIW